MASAECSGPQELSEPLTLLLRGRGIDVQHEGEWLTFPHHPGKIQGLVFDRNDVHTLASTQVDIRFSPWPGCLIRESFGGMGETRDARIRCALETFAANTLHVLLKVFLDVDCSGQVNQYEVTNQGVRFKVKDGNVFLRASGPAEPTRDWFPRFRGLLETWPLTEGTHWIRLYYAQLDRRPTALELLLDNDDWAEAAPRARELPWPKLDGFLSLRLFVVIQGGVDVVRAAGVMARNADADDKRLKELLVASGLTALDARRLIVLMPIAFGGRLLDRMGIVCPTICRIDDGHSRSTIDLVSSSLFQRSRALADSAFSKGSLSRDEFLAIAARDASFQAVNKALHAGSDPKNLRLAAPTIRWRESAPLCPVGLGVSTPPRRKPWWRF
jgi:hypothetical protein